MQTAQTYTKNSFNYHDLLKCGKGELFGPENARLPLPGMLMFERVVKITEHGGHYGQGEIIAELDIKPDLWFFDCHFEGDPVMPGCLGLDAMWQLIGFYLLWRGHSGKGRALGVKEVKFSDQILPTIKKVRYHIHIRRVIKRGIVMAVGDGYVEADGRQVYQAQGLKVGLFGGGFESAELN